MISEVQLEAPDLPMDDTESKSEELKDTPSNKQEVDPHDPVKKEVVIPPDVDREAPKEHDVAPQEICGNGLLYPLRLGPNGELGRPGRRSGNP
jgi:hypothetical protein